MSDAGGGDTTSPDSPPFLVLARPGPPAPLPPGLVTHAGACHCGAIAFEADAPPLLPVVQCNCSRCRLIGGPFCILPAGRFRLVRADPPPAPPGTPALTRYRFNTGAALHTFCALCGVQAFYRPRSNPDCVSVLVPALDGATVAGTTLTTFDGEHWEEAFAAGGAPKPAG